jgi:Cu-Zn family superoxide dismutase
VDGTESSQGGKQPECSRFYDEDNQEYCPEENDRQVACAIIHGGPLAPKLKGKVFFEEVSGGTCVAVEVWGLPPYRPAQNDQQPIGPHGFHLHEKGICKVGDPNNPFMAAGSHWNPTNQPHGNHAGDFPVLFSNHGVAMVTFFTDKFTVADVVGKSVIIHQNPDDYRTQEPAGNAGKRLACGVIKMCE